MNHLIITQERKNKKKFVKSGIPRYLSPPLTVEGIVIDPKGEIEKHASVLRGKGFEIIEVNLLDLKDKDTIKNLGKGK